MLARLGALLDGIADARNWFKHQSFWANSWTVGIKARAKEIAANPLSLAVWRKKGRRP